jgi:hypothetical protein
MRNGSLVCLLLVSLTWQGFNPAPAANLKSQAERPQPPAIRITVDTSEVPDVAEWARQAKELAEKWHPRIVELLHSEGFTPPSKVKIVFKKDMKGVAYTAGATIVIAADWIKKHPDDFGMVVHELAHVVQAYRGGNRNAGWLIEGIADYVRFYHYEPKTKLSINPRRASYRDGYRTAAMFLAWVEKMHDKEIVRKLNAALRKGEYRDELFKKYTSKSLDELWTAFVAAQERK